jgi:hypothetical protein
LSGLAASNPLEFFEHHLRRLCRHWAHMTIQRIV